jgi:hypothetical protein
MRRAVKLWEAAGYWKDRAAGAIAHAKYKERPDVRPGGSKPLRPRRQSRSGYYRSGKSSALLVWRLQAHEHQDRRKTPTRNHGRKPAVNFGRVRPLRVRILGSL